MPNHTNDKSQTTKQVDADYSHYHARLDVPRCMLSARNDCGKSYISQILEIWSLARGIGHLTAQDYYYYQLCDDSRFSPEE